MAAGPRAGARARDGSVGALGSVLAVLTHLCGILRQVPNVETFCVLDGLGVHVLDTDVDTGYP